ncbi:Protein of unknown function [Butyrivibrio hungatei]|uniref:DUF4007 domain-containing protein n=1 Tax=Butyrivibrio hungatei TaxID=185008 RepID=A0A1G5BDL7_9FIRM|nr:DUF4007 family protein [Butyrivibrio hungatei]SCX88252.1 Protein of unknown function [Butyrivibrio hungatei]
MATSKIKLRLQGHEKFALREGWLNKGLIIVNENSGVFQSEEAPDIFGIGNNMVKSVRYWLRAFGLISETPGKGASLTEIGRIIYDNDLYFEDVFTLWILHSNIAKNIEEATSWFMFFNRCQVDDLNRDQIQQILKREITKYAEGTTFSDNSVKSDVDVILNMYSNTKEITDPEDKNISPFSELKLLKKVDGRYSKVHADRRVVNEWVVLYELANKMLGLDSISIEELAINENGLQNIYQMNFVMINDYLDKLDALGYIHVDRTAGLDMIYREKEFSPVEVLEEYYRNSR